MKVGKAFPTIFLLLGRALAYRVNLAHKNPNVWKLGAKTFFPQRAPKSVWSGNKKRKKKITHKIYARQQPAGRDQQVREHQQKKKRIVGELQCWQINAAAKRSAASKLIEAVGGEGGRRRATQKINWKKKKVMNSQTGSATWVLIWLNTHSVTSCSISMFTVLTSENTWCRQFVFMETSSCSRGTKSAFFPQTFQGWNWGRMMVLAKMQCHHLA